MAKDEPQGQEADTRLDFRPTTLEDIIYSLHKVTTMTQGQDDDSKVTTSSQDSRIILTKAMTISYEHNIPGMNGHLHECVHSGSVPKEVKHPKRTPRKQPLGQTLLQR
jgi:hypothetical protein